MASVVVLDDYQQVAAAHGPWHRLPEGTRLTFLPRHIADDDELVDAIGDADIVVAMRERTPLPARLLRRLPKLRLIVTTGMANASIDMAAAREQGIAVAGTGHSASAPAELTWALILGLARRIAVEDASIRRGGWQTSVGTDLAGRTLGVIGLGRIGTRVARVGLAFGMRVVAWSQNLEAAAAAAEGVEAVGKGELLAASDVVSLHLRLGERSRGVIGTAELAAMRPSALLVNTARSALVDRRALLDALHSGTIAGAGLDVFDEEPLPPDDELRSAPHTLLTPHLGYVSEDTYDIYFRDAVEDIEHFLNGTALRVLNDVGGD